MQVRLLPPLGLSLVVALWAFGVTAQPQILRAEMWGGHVVGGGDGNGWGSATLGVECPDSQLRTIKYVVAAYQIGQPTAVHIHHAGPGQNGFIAATLKTLPNGNTAIDGEVTTREPWARSLCRLPNDFYIDVHTVQFPNGALRGQLD